jgi:hypothetical protein
MKETGGPGENHQPVATHLQTLSHDVVSSAPRHAKSEIRARNIIGDRSANDHDHDNPDSSTFCMTHYFCLNMVASTVVVCEDIQNSCFGCFFSKQLCKMGGCPTHHH